MSFWLYVVLPVLIGLGCLYRVSKHRGEENSVHRTIRIIGWLLLGTAAACAIAQLGFGRGVIAAFCTASVVGAAMILIPGLTRLASPEHPPRTRSGRGSG